MTQLIPVTKTEFAAIKGNILPFYHYKKGSKKIAVGDRLIFQEVNGEDHPTGEEKETEITHIYEGEATKAGWTCLGWKEKEV
jgi:hypothetical protein